jgi:hypothetical protein
MFRATAILFCLAVFTAMTGCEPYIRNCPIIGKSPSSNLYHLDYELLIPADCPIPLASPGTEEKFAAARVWDYGNVDMRYASVVVKNSKGKEKARELTVFVGTPGLMFADPKADYIAATGTQTFSDHDVGIFRAFNDSDGKSADGQTRLTYQQASLATSLVGEEIPQPNTTHTWTAPVSGGYPGFSYQWYRNGSPVGTGSSYTASAGGAPFNLRVEVTDQTWSMVAAVLAVEVGGIRTAISGPTNVWASEGGGTWTASAQGGTGPYNYTWYLDSVLFGYGPTITTYTGENAHHLEVRVTDTAGAFHSDRLEVFGVGSGNGGCEPVPPAVACDGGE